MTVDPKELDPKGKGVEPPVDVPPAGDPTPPTPPTPPAPPAEEVKTMTQTELDAMLAKVRGETERKIKSKLLKDFGVDDETKIPEIKQAYLDKLTDAEKKDLEMNALAESKRIADEELATQKAIVKVLTKLNVGGIDIEEIINSAKGHVKEDFTMEEAIEKVLPLYIKKQEGGTNPTIPRSQPLHQPEGGVSEKNPFVKGADYDEEAQRKLYTEDKAKAVELAREAIKINNKNK